jgi:hypothetical protein
MTKHLDFHIRVEQITSKNKKRSRNVIEREIPTGIVDESYASLFIERRKLKTNSQIHIRIKTKLHIHKKYRTPIKYLHCKNVYKNGNCMLLYICIKDITTE